MKLWKLVVAMLSIKLGLCVVVVKHEVGYLAYFECFADEWTTTTTTMGPYSSLTLKSSTIFEKHYNFLIYAL